MGTKLLTLSCNQCGAPLSAPEGTRFLTCAHCTSRLLIEYSGDAYYTSVLERIEKQVAGTETSVEEVRLQLAIERCEREWLVTKEKYMVNSRNGSKLDPRAALESERVGMTLSGIAIFVGFSIPVGIGGKNAAPVAILMAFVLAFILFFGWYRVDEGRERVRAYESARAVYGRRKADLQRKIKEL